MMRLERRGWTRRRAEERAARRSVPSEGLDRGHGSCDTCVELSLNQKSSSDLPAHWQSLKACEAKLTRSSGERGKVRCASLGSVECVAFTSPSPTSPPALSQSETGSLAQTNNDRSTAPHLFPSRSKSPQVSAFPTRQHDASPMPPKGQGGFVHPEPKNLPVHRRPLRDSLVPRRRHDAQPHDPARALDGLARTVLHPRFPRGG